jgi:DNA primase
VIDVLRLLDALGIEYTRRGSQLRARCPHPDHEDLNPSWTIVADEGGRHGFHHCFACQWGGGPVALVAAVLGLEPKDARAWLEDGDYAVTKLELELDVRERPAVAGLGVPPEVQFIPLERWPKAAREYLERRGFGAATVDRWGLGVVSATEKTQLRGRIFIPVLDDAGEFRTYQARAFGKAATRYLTPTAGPPAIFGCQYWPAPVERQVVVVPEGPFDALAVDAATGLPVGSLLGSDPQPWQLLRLATFRVVVVLTDPDAAGRKAATALQAALARWTRVVLHALPAGRDPAQVYEDDPVELRAMLQFVGGLPGDGHRVVVSAGPGAGAEAVAGCARGE